MLNENERRLAVYDSWANKLMLRAIDQIGAAAEGNARLLKLLGHLVGAKEMWLARIRGEDTSKIEIWPTLKLLDAAQRLAKADAGLIALVTQRADLKSPVRYKNSKGEAFENSIRDLVVHMVNHSTYHRGQMATAIKEAGGDMGFTDYVMWLRQFPGGVPVLPNS